MPTLQQRWRDVLFLHWPCAPEVVAGLLPPGLRPDLYDGQAWVSLTPFRVEAARPGFAPALPRLSQFPETNLRTYVVGPDGADGLWFLALETDSGLSVLGGRVAGAPYRWARMSVEHEGPQVVYRSRRRGGGAGHRIRVEPSSPVAGGDLDHWLTGRWRAWVQLAGRLRSIPVQHEPWPLHDVEVVEMEESLRAAHGVPASRGGRLAHFAPGVDARLGAPRSPASDVPQCT